MLSRLNHNQMNEREIRLYLTFRNSNRSIGINNNCLSSTVKIMRKYVIYIIYIRGKKIKRPLENAIKVFFITST